MEFASPRAAESLTLVVVFTLGFIEGTRKKVQDRGKDDSVLLYSLQLRLCRIWAGWKAQSSTGDSAPALKAPGSVLTSLMPPSAKLGARRVIHHFRAKPAWIIKDSALGTQILPLGWNCT